MVTTNGKRSGFRRESNVVNNELERVLEHKNDMIQELTNRMNRLEIAKE